MADEIVILDVAGTPITLACTRAGEGEPILIGESARAHAGNERTSSTGEKRTWNLVTSRLPTEIKTAIRKIIARRNQIYCMGELLSENPVIDPLNLAGPNWVKNTMTVAGGVADPFGGFNAITATATAAFGDVVQALTTSQFLLKRRNMVWLRRRTGVGLVDVINPGNTFYEPAAITSAWRTFTSTDVVASTTRIMRAVRIANIGDAVDVYAPSMTGEPCRCSVRLNNAEMMAGVSDHELALTLVEV